MIGYPTAAAYTASKHGLVGLTEAVALETAETAITCNAICPGYTDTALMRRVFDETAGLWGVTAGAARRRMIEADHPSKAMVAPQDLGALAVFLAGEAAAQIRGAALPVDGGWTRALDHHVAAVYVHRGADVIGAGVRGQQHGGGRDLVDVGETAQGLVAEVFPCRDSLLRIHRDRG